MYSENAYEGPVWENITRVGGKIELALLHRARIDNQKRWFETEQQAREAVAEAQARSSEMNAEPDDDYTAEEIEAIDLVHVALSRAIARAGGYQAAMVRMQAAIAAGRANA